MDNTLDALTKSFDKLFVTTAQNILGSDIKICKWSFIFTSIGIGINILLNSFYFVKMNNENKMLKNKLDLILNEQKFIMEGNLTIYDYITKNIKNIKNTDLIINDKEMKKENEVEEYDFLYCN
jgi:hypothetical protein